MAAAVDWTAATKARSIPRPVAARMAAVSPATPLPRTRTSSGGSANRCFDELPIPLVDVDDLGLEAFELGVLVVGIGDDDDLVARMYQTGGRAVEADVA